MLALRLVIYGGIHDGPVTSITTSPFIENLILSIGGRIIAIWNNNVQDGPIFWKKSKFTLTSCSWSKSQPSHFYVSCSNGSIEVWDLLLRSDKPYFVQDVSGKIITGLYPQKVDNINNILGVADYNGSFQAYLTPAYTALETEKQVSRTVRLVNKQTEHLRMLVIWHNEWRESHSEYLILKKQMINEELRKREVVVKAKKRQILERKKLEEENQRLRRSKVSLLSKEAHSTQRWLVSQENYMKQIIIGKKNLCRKELLQKQEPLITLKRQEEEKKQKEQQILAEKSSLVEKLTADLLPVIKNNEKYYTTTDERRVSTVGDCERLACYVVSLGHRQGNNRYTNLWEICCTPRVRIMLLRDGERFRDGGGRYLKAEACSVTASQLRFKPGSPHHHQSSLLRGSVIDHAATENSIYPTSLSGQAVFTDSVAIGSKHVSTGIAPLALFSCWVDSDHLQVDVISNGSTLTDTRDELQHELQHHSMSSDLHSPTGTTD
uniref:Uncharacterized protein n=1 Tax=Timema douglasi TaxID=61478 RepID=A0A7R8VJJ8_TIMDO|nr:unnamed protein product [Timema douglasi]